MAWDVPTTATVGQILTAAFWNAEVKGNMDYLKGGVGGFTPTVDQGVTTNIGCTINEARYTRAGDMCDFWFTITMNAAGTSGAVVTVDLPLTPTGHFASATLGSGFYFDSGVQEYAGAWRLSGAAATALYPHGSAATGLGASPTLAVAAGDVLSGQLRYHVA